MREVSGTVTDTEIRVALSGRIDSANFREAERELSLLTAGRGALPVVLDGKDLNYISSSGLRVLLRLKKTNPELRFVNVSSEVYEVLDMTGFTQLLKVEKAFRTVSVEGCEVLGRGAHGTIYRIDRDTVVKVYASGDALSDIRHEREMARTALVLGIPTAISYDVVRVGEGYGAVFELLNARSLSGILASSPGEWDRCVREFAALLKKIHATVAPQGSLPDQRDLVLAWAGTLRDVLPEEEGNRLVSLVEAVPRDRHLLHGDYHTNNLELQDGEVLLIDMEDLAAGHPIFELGSIHNTYVGYSEYDREAIRHFIGIDAEAGKRFWNQMLAAYLGTEDPRRLREVTDKARIVGYARLLQRALRHRTPETERGRAEFELWKEELISLLHRTDTLLFDRTEEALPSQGKELPV